MQIGFLGAFDVRTDEGLVIEVPGSRLRALLVALALEPGRIVPKATLVDWIWAEQPPSDATNALQRLVSRLRKLLPEGTVEGRTGGYGLQVSSEAVDAVRFEDLVRRARSVEDRQRVSLLREALGLWRGPAMQDIDLYDSAAFDAAVTRLEALRLSATEDRFEAEVALGHAVGLIPELSDVVAAHPERERLAAALVRALASAGRDTEALHVYERTRTALVEALGVDPSPELSALHAAVLRGELRPQQEEQRTTNVPSELTSFVGRDDDVAIVRDLVAEHRLTTLIGPGGSGKTRLGTETARAMLGELPDGAWLVELAVIGADDEVAQATVAALGLRDALLGTAPNADPTDALVAAIRDREMLLILDNCEHVIESAATFAHRVLGACRRVRILATSREPLGITGEALWLVEPLPLPDDDADTAGMLASPAVRLLRDRASAIRKDALTDDHDVAAMVRICRALDGMPLAIELAAARLRTMTLDQLANRLDDRFRLLTGGSRTALPRHRTLRAVIDWSWELLSDAERVVLQRLSVFSGDASLEAAERVATGDAVAPEQVLELLTSLVEKSLLVTAGGDEPRYRMLGTIKEYAADRLAEAGESELARRAHLTYVTELAEAAEPHLRRAEQLEWLHRLEADHDDLSAALRTAIAAGDAGAAMRLAAATGWYWWLSGRRTEGLELLIAAANLPGDATDDARGMTYGYVTLFLTSGLGDEYVGAEWIEKAYELNQQAQRRDGGMIHAHRIPLLEFATPLKRMLEGPEEAALTALEELLGSSDPWVRAMGRWQLGKLRTAFGQWGPDVEVHLQTALAEFQELGERFGISLALSEIASLLAKRGEFAGACDHFERAATVLAELGAVEDVIEVRTRQAMLYLLDGDREASAATITEAERLAEGVTWPYALGSLALAKAGIARLTADAAEARRQLDFAAAILAEVAEMPHFRAYIDDELAYLAEDLDEARRHRRAAWEAASEFGAPASIAQSLVGMADLALRLERYEQAAQLLAAGDRVRGTVDRSHPDLARIEGDARRHLGEQRFAEVTREGAKVDPAELAEVTLAT